MSQQLVPRKPQFRPRYPHFDVDIKEISRDPQFSLRPGISFSGRHLNLPGLSGIAPTQQNTSTIQDSAAVHHAQSGHAQLPARHQRKEQTIRYSIYTFCFFVTLAALIATWLRPQPALAWQSSAVLVVMALLTIFSSPVMVKMVAFLAVAPWYNLLTRKQTFRYIDTSFQPLVSVLIPAYNEEVGLVATVKTLLASSYPYLEIVVVNDGSSDGSDAKMRQFLVKYQWTMRNIPDAIPIIYHYQQNAGKATALNTALALAHGDIVVSIDADCVIDEGCIAAFVEAFRDTRVMAACGNVKVGNPKHLLSYIQLCEYTTSFYARQADAALGTLYVISGAAGAFRRSILDQIGLYSTDLRGGGEDVDLSIRVQKAGGKIAYVPGSIVYTEVPTSVIGLTKQRKRWTLSRFATFKKYHDMIFSTKKEHNKLLTCLVIPLIILNDWSYIPKMVLKIGLYIVATVLGAWYIFTMLIIVSTILAALPLLHERDERRYLVLTPISWLLSFIPAFIECYAIGSAIVTLITKREATWQSWQRAGAVGVVKRP